MRFLSNDELRVVIAHEFAHNAMGHIKAKKKNSIFGAVLGALGDVFMASQGINTGGYYTSQGAKAGATVFSQDFEREADYVGLYALTLADLPLDPAPMFWRHMAQAEPKSIGFASTHPTTAERFVRMEQAITEIREKTASHQALLPSKKGAPESGAEEPKLAVANPLPQRITTPVSASNPLAQMINTDARAPTADSPLPAVSGYSAMADTLPDYVARPDETTFTDPKRTKDFVTGRPELKAAIDDLVRLGMVTEYGEIRSGLLRLEVGNAFIKHSAIEFHLSLLYEAYGEVSGTMATFELFRQGIKIGQYSKDGLSLVDP
jgi:hypothetical protein